MPRTLPVTGSHAEGPGPVRGTDLIEQGVRDGIISIDQAEQLRALSSHGPVTPAGDGGGRVGAYVAEALGYVGAALVLVAGVVIAQGFWADLTPRSHAALLGVLAVVLLATGALVHGDAGTPIGRLGSFLWLLAVGAVAATAAVVAGEVAELEEAVMGMAITVPTTIVAALLWWRRRRSLQELAVLAGLLFTGVATLAWVDVALEDWAGLLVWSIGVAWLLLAWGAVVRPVRTGRVAGAVAALLGPMMTFGATGRWGVVLGVVTAGGLVAASVPARETVLLGLGVLGLFVFVPRGVFEFFGEQLGAPLALLASGGVLLGVALWISRARRDGPSGTVGR